MPNLTPSKVLVKDLARDITNEEGKVVPFIGAGFSKNAATDFPNFEELLPALNRFLSLIKNCSAKIDNYDLIKRGTPEVIQTLYFEKAKELGHDSYHMFKREKLFAAKEAFFDFLKNEFNSIEGKLDKDLSLHTRITNTFRIIYTTNWDSLIEQASPSHEPLTFPIIVQSRDEVVLKKTPRDDVGDKTKQFLFKLHGCFRENKCYSLVASQEDYFTQIRLQSNAIDPNIYNQLLEKHILFLGYSVRDLNIKYVINQLRFHFGSLKKHDPSFTMVDGFPEDREIESLKTHLGINVISLKEIEPSLPFITGDNLTDEDRRQNFVSFKNGYDLLLKQVGIS